MARLFYSILILSVSLMATFGATAAADEQHTVLITGANRGLGFEFVRQFSARGYRVIATARKPERADELNAFAAAHEAVSVEKLDLIDHGGIDDLAAKYSGQPIDVLINNAALMRGPDAGQSFGTIDYQAFDLFFDTNVKGPLKVAEAFWPNVVASEQGIVVSLTTSQGRQGIPVPGFAFYKSSKAAIDNLHRDIGRRGRRDGVRVLTLIPGRVATHGEQQTRGMVPIEKSISGMIEVMENATLKQNGKSFWYNGAESNGA
ncbi:MAG: SDR family NAD(P)-dependent oxidoreductase [Gammaproteobacteria bacterium]